MTKQFTADEVNEIVTDRLSRERKKYASELACWKQRLDDRGVALKNANKTIQTLSRVIEEQLSVSEGSPTHE